MVMGELSPAEWTAELERSGRVVFPLRGRPYLRRVGVLLPLCFGGVVLPLASLGGSDGTERLMFLLVLGLSALAFAAFVLAALSRRPYLVVTPNTIHLGKQAVAWPTDVRLLRDYVLAPDVLEDWLNHRCATHQ